MNPSNKFTLINCNSILSHFCTNANTIAIVKITTGKTNPTPSEIEQCFDACLDFLIANQLIVKTRSRCYEITDDGRAFYRNNGFNL